MAQDVVAVLDAAGIRRAHVLGASLGGFAAAVTSFLQGPPGAYASSRA
jgi:pimeloyl-ACP methyl ester carboxylesterase